MRKILTRIAVAEGKGRAVEEVEGIVASSRGDIRHAILTLQLQLQGRRSSSLPSSSSSFLSGGGKKKKNTKKEEEAEARKGRRKGGKEGLEEEEEEQKDAYMSNFHAIGKVLFAKRYPPKEDEEGREGEREGGRGRLSFVPEEVLGKCEMEVESSSTFIQAHCVQHYGEMDDLSQALQLFSDADVLLARVYSTAFVSLGREGGREGGRAYVIYIQAHCVCSTMERWTS